MPSIDQFESLFKSASREIFTHQPADIRRVLIATDLDRTAGEELMKTVRKFLGVLEKDHPVTWDILQADDFRSVGELLDVTTKRAPDLVVTYRHLHSNAWNWPYSLGEHLDVLTQVTEIPVLVIPHPNRQGIPGHVLKNTNRVMAITDELNGDSRLVNYSLQFTEDRGKLFLAHLESRRVFERYMSVIAKLPDLDTELARSEIMAKLLKEPEDYFLSCQAVIGELNRGIEMESIVALGYHVQFCLELIGRHGIDLLVMNTKNEEQLAMHGMAYPLAVELRSIPLLML